MWHDLGVDETQDKVDYVPPALCFGCRANEAVPLGPADEFGRFEGGWERFTCERCGVEDVRPSPHSERGDDV